MSDTPDRGSPAWWDERYQTGNTPWEIGGPSPELQRVLAEEAVPAGAALDLGCGSGPNSVYLAQRGFQVTGVDVAETALERARERARQRGVTVEFRQENLASGCDLGGPYDFVFDRGCYHILRNLDATAYARSLAAALRPEARMLLLAGNADEPMQPGPPVVTAAALIAEMEPLFRILWLRRVRFEPAEAGEPNRPLGWSLFMARR